MIDIDAIKPGDRVLCLRQGIYIKNDGTVGEIQKDKVYTVANPPVNIDYDTVSCEVEDSINNGVVAFGADSLFLVSHFYGVADAVFSMRNAGPPQPDCCICDIVSLMNVGCRCGWLAREREGKEDA